LPDEEKANIYHTIAKQLYNQRSYKEAQKLFISATNLYVAADDKNLKSSRNIILDCPNSITSRQNQ